MRTLAWLAPLLLAVAACQNGPRAAADAAGRYGQVLRLSPALDAVIDPEAAVEWLAEGFQWAEGPLWVAEQQMLLFSDVPTNRVYRWRPGLGVDVYLKPSGYTGLQGRREGANGLALDGEGRLLLCQHGDRRLARMLAPLDAPEADFLTLADRYQGRRLNSPNDLAVHSSGAVYFTDPPYGLAGDPPAIRELPFNGVYRWRDGAGVELLEDGLSRPNGIAFSPDEARLYVANSDPERAIWMVYPVQADGRLGPGRVFFDATAAVAEAPGLPDGLKVDRRGVIFATGPGGVWIFTPTGEHLGTVQIDRPVANVALDEAGGWLYMTADDRLLRIRLR